MTGERDFTFRAVGGVFLFPFIIDLLGVVVMMVGIGGAINAGVLDVENLLFEEVGTLKLGVVGGGEHVRLVRGGGIPNVE